MQAELMCKGVGKYKPKFDSTGLLFASSKGEFWADIKGDINYKDYKGKMVKIDIEKDDKGYWHGEIIGGSASADTGKNRAFAMSYAKDLVVANREEMSRLYGLADAILAWLDGTLPPEEPAQSEAAGPNDDDIPF